MVNNKATHSKSKSILNVGSYLPVKDQLILIKAYALLPKNLISEYTLIIAGKTGTLLPTLKALVQELNLEERVIFKENASHRQVVDLMYSSEIFVLSSEREGFPLVLLEAGFIELPIVSFDVGGVSELINNKNGVLLKARNMSDLAKAMEYALLNLPECKLRASRLKQKISDHYTWERIVVQLVELAKTAHV